MARGKDFLRQRSNRNDNNSAELPMTASHETSRPLDGEANQWNWRRRRRLGTSHDSSKRSPQLWWLYGGTVTSQLQQSPQSNRRGNFVRHYQLISFVLGVIGFGSFLLLFMSKNNVKVDSIQQAHNRNSHHLRLMNMTQRKKSIEYDFPCQSNNHIRGILNDDYCDCPDGSDEPNTSACSHILVGKKVFSCNEHGIDGGKIFSSRVMDGIVDCQNGKDEKKFHS